MKQLTLLLALLIFQSPANAQIQAGEKKNGAAQPSWKELEKTWICYRYGGFSIKRITQGKETYEQYWASGDLRFSHKADMKVFRQAGVNFYTKTNHAPISPKKQRIQKVEIRPCPVAMSQEIRSAIDEADLFIFGPGSLYTSVIPNLLIDGLMDLINATGRQRIYICNIMTQPGETDGYTLCDHLAALRVHVGNGFPDAVVAHAGMVPPEIIETYKDVGSEAVACDLNGQAEYKTVRLVTGSFFDQEEAVGQRGWGTHDECLARHDSDALARVIYDEFLKEGSSLGPAGNGEASDGGT